MALNIYLMLACVWYEDICSISVCILLELVSCIAAWLIKDYLEADERKNIGCIGNSVNLPAASK